MKLDIGCGKNKKSGYIGIDIKANEGVQYVLDIEKDSLPFKDNSISEIRCYHVLEHLADIQYAMSEIYRVLKKDGILEISVPYYKHPTTTQPFHKLSFGITSFDSYTKRSARMDFIYDIRFKELKREVIFLDGFLSKLMTHLANNNYYLYEKLWSNLFPARRILWILQKDSEK